MKQFLENPKAFGYTISHDQFYQTINTKNVSEKGPVPDWTVWAAKHGVSYSQLKDFNIWLRDRKLTNSSGKEYIIQLPLKEDLMFNPAKIKIYNPMWVTF
jgi:hypothetical protein